MIKKKNGKNPIRPFALSFINWVDSRKCEQNNAKGHS